MIKLILLVILFLPAFLFSQQIADTTFNPIIQNPEYEPCNGPVVFIDEGHNNFHTKNGLYKAFSNLLERDGYKVKGYIGKFNKAKLSEGRILVIANALNKINIENWYLPNPSAFTKAEIDAVKKWVFDGGSLFLIADHMPMSGAAKDLAAEFGFEFSNGIVLDTVNRGPSIFNLKEKTLVESLITKGRNATESVRQIVSFTGQAFKIPDDATSVLIFNQNHINFLCDTAWIFKNDTPRFTVKGWSQGAYKKYGKGNIAVFGEAAMFTAQLTGPQKIKTGMNYEHAPENYQLLLNIIHWLDGKLE